MEIYKKKPVYLGIPILMLLLFFLKKGKVDAVILLQREHQHPRGWQHGHR